MNSLSSQEQECVSHGRDSEMTVRSRRGPLQEISRRILLSRFRRLRYGAITLVEGGDQRQYGSITPACPLHTVVTIRDPRSYIEITFGGSIGGAEAYVKGLWDCDDLTTLMRILVLNRDVLDGMEQGLARILSPIRKVVHACHRNTRRGSRRNIRAHYDLSNEFFSLFLDQTMMYSCAIFERPDMTLEEASRAKNERICRKLQLSPKDHLLEIGTGWGGFAIHAAKHYGCRVTTTTISQQQYELASQRIRSAGLSDRITVQLKDYRDLHGQFDKLVSIEMIEAVGHEFYETFFKTCSTLLKPESVMLLQAITIDDQRYEQARRSVDFIQRFIFPGSCIPSVTALSTAVTHVTDLRLFDLEDIGAHYPKTLHYWRAQLLSNAGRLRAMGYSNSFLRTWEYYFSYCEGGFLERAISDVQILFVKPLCRRTSALPS